MGVGSCGGGVIWGWGHMGRTLMYVFYYYCYYFESLRSRSRQSRMHDNQKTTSMISFYLFRIMDLFHGRVEDGQVNGFDQHRRCA